VSGSKRRSHQTSPVGIPIPIRDFDCESDTPIEIPEASNHNYGKGLDVSIGFSTTNKWFSAVIRWITRGAVSHAWIAYNDHTLGLRMVLQAEAWCVELRPWQRWLKENKWVSEFRLINRNPLVALQNRAHDIGAKYDWKAGFWTGLASWVKRWIKVRFTFRPSRSPKRLMCSEVVVRFLKDLNVACVKELDEETTSPAELLDSVRCSMDFVPVRRVR